MRYKAPELLLGGIPTPSSDLYALALTAVEILSERRPFGALEGAQLAIAIAQGLKPRLDHHLEPAGRCVGLWATFERMWEGIPQERLDILEAHRAFSVRRSEGLLPKASLSKGCTVM